MQLISLKAGGKKAELAERHNRLAACSRLLADDPIEIQSATLYSNETNAFTSRYRRQNGNTSHLLLTTVQVNRKNTMHSSSVLMLFYSLLINKIRICLLYFIL